MTQHPIHVAIVATALAAVMPQAGRAEEPRQNLKQCFTAGDIENWRAGPDASTIFIRAANGHYYRIDLSRECAPLKLPDARLITHSFGAGLICSPTDFTVGASEAMGFFEPCFVHGMRELSAEEAAALPRKVKP